MSQKSYTVGVLFRTKLAARFAPSPAGEVAGSAAPSRM